MEFSSASRVFFCALILLLASITAIAQSPPRDAVQPAFVLAPHSNVWEQSLEFEAIRAWDHERHRFLADGTFDSFEASEKAEFVDQMLDDYYQELHRDFRNEPPVGTGKPELAVREITVSIRQQLSHSPMLLRRYDNAQAAVAEYRLRHMNDFCASETMSVRET